ncbi:MAG: electron transfer flavoprotein subunit beta/FixA family protein [Syntrophales bacterium]
MRMLVLVKQTPAAEAEIGISEDASAVLVGENCWRMNRFDEFALEEALRIREAFPGSSVEAVSVGPLRVAAVLRRALAMGADKAIHILQDGNQYLFPDCLAFLMAAFVRDNSFDLILAGVMSEDAMQGQTGPMLAEMLGMPCATAVVAQRMANGRITVDRELEGGFRERLEMPLPALIAVQSGINRPRYPALSHVLRSRSQPLLTIPADTLPEAPRRQRLSGLAWPAPSEKALFLEGTAERKAESLAGIFAGRALL